MKYIKYAIGAWLVVATMVANGVEAAAQNIPPPSIAVLDIQGILKNALAAKDIRSQARKLRLGFQKEIRRQEDKLRKEEQTIAQQRTVLSSSAYAEKRQKFELSARQARRDVQSRKQNMEAAFGVAMEKVRRLLVDIAQELAMKNKVNIVLPKSVVFLSIKKLDITPQALKQLDKRLPSVKVVVKAKK